MNLSIAAVSESKRDLLAAARGAEQLDEPWFAEPDEQQRRISSRPPPASAVIKIGEFLGDPEVDAWLR